MNQDLSVVIITGISGSGKSTTVRQFEDMGFFCVDNLPTDLIPKFLMLCEQPGNEIDRVALVVDIREKKFLQSYSEVFDVIRNRGIALTVLFLEASDAVLIRRFNETRRKHPLAKASVQEGLAQEREMLAGMKENADIILDTSDYSIHDLREVLKKHFARTVNGSKMAILLVAFGFKYGIVSDSDMILDVRFLKNPYFVDQLREQSGRSPEVIKYVAERDETREYLKRLHALLDYLVPRYIREGKSYFTIGFGCTGGRHRSVVIADLVQEHLEAQGYQTSIRYRDISRG
jgi:UPF0042 nucleotide-binding protein